jgi:hypothetical protein
MDKHYNTIESDHDPCSRVPHESHESYMLVRAVDYGCLSLRHALAAQHSTTTHIVVRTETKGGVARKVK